MAQIKINSSKIRNACRIFIKTYEASLEELRQCDYVDTYYKNNEISLFESKYNERLRIVIIMENMACYAIDTKFQYLILSDYEFSIIMRYL